MREHGTDAKRLVERQFYVDDCLASVATPEEAIDILTRTREMLTEYNLLLHKVSSNNKQMMKAFPVEGRAKSIKDQCRFPSSPAKLGTVMEFGNRQLHISDLL